MCETCNPALPQMRPSAALIARTREIEAALPGDRASDDAFAVFFGRRGGSIPWAQYQRLVQCMEAAMRHDSSAPLLTEGANARWRRSSRVAAAALTCDGGSNARGSSDVA